MNKPILNIKHELNTIKDWIRSSEFIGNISGETHVTYFKQFQDKNLIKNYGSYIDGNYYKANGYTALDYLLSVVYLFGRSRAIEDLDVCNSIGETVGKEIENDNTDNFKEKFRLNDIVYFFKMPNMDAIYKGIIVGLNYNELIVKDDNDKTFTIEWDEVYKGVIE